MREEKRERDKSMNKERDWGKNRHIDIYSERVRE